MSAFWHFAECTGMALIQVLSLTALYGLVRRLRTSPEFRLVNDKPIDPAVYTNPMIFSQEFMHKLIDE